MLSHKRCDPKVKVKVKVKISFLWDPLVKEQLATAQSIHPSMRDRDSLRQTSGLPLFLEVSTNTVDRTSAGPVEDH
jgi:hypothetical protein